MTLIDSASGWMLRLESCISPRYLVNWGDVASVVKADVEVVKMGY